MNDYRETFERELVEASRRLNPPERSTKRSGVRFSRRTMSVAAAGLVCVGTAAAATTPWSPRLGDPTRPENQPVAITSPPPASQLAAFGALRREASPADRDAVVADALQYLGTGTTGIRTGYVRRVGTTPSGAPAILVPAERWERGDGHVVSDPLCLVLPDPSAVAAVKNCWSTKEIRAGQATGSYGLDTYGLVPDEVRRIAASETTLAAANDNFFSFSSEQDASDPEAGVPAQASQLSGINRQGDVVWKSEP